MPLDLTRLDVTAETVTVDDAAEFTITIGAQDTALDVSAATVTVTDDGTLDVNSLPSLPAGDNNVGSVNIDGQPLDVSAAVVSVQENTALDVSAATVTVDQASTVTVQEDTPLDVSASTVQVQESTPLDVSASEVPVDSQHRGVLVDGSGTIQSASVAQTVFSASVDRKFLLVQNLADVTLFVNIGSKANEGAGSIPLNPTGGSGAGGALTFEGEAVPTGSVSIIGPTSGAAFTAKEIQ